MKKYYKISLPILTAIIAIFFAGCAKDLTNTVYNGPDLVEFANPIAKTITTTTTAKLDSAVIQLVGAQRSTSTSIAYSVNPSSTAVAGTDYTIVNASPVAITPNTSNVVVRFSFNKVAATKTLILDLTGGDAVTPSVNYRTFTFTLK